MKKIHHLKFHFFSYRFLILGFILLLISSSIIFGLIKFNNNPFLYIAISLLVFMNAFLGFYEKKENVNIFLNININRKSYLICDFLNIFFITIIHTLVFVGIYFLYQHLNLNTLNFSLILWFNFFVILLFVNRIFNFISLYLNNFSLVILIISLFLFIFFNPIDLINYLINFEKQILLLYSIIIGIIFIELLIVLTINRINLIFKKSLSSR